MMKFWRIGQKLGKFEPGKFNGTPKRVACNISVADPGPPEYIKTGQRIFPVGGEDVRV